jgi:hypothetical protein
MIVVILYGISLEGISLISKKGAWMFMVIVTIAIMMTYPGFADEVLWFTGSARNYTQKGAKVSKSRGGKRTK